MARTYQLGIRLLGKEWKSELIESAVECYDIAEELFDSAAATMLEIDYTALLYIIDNNHEIASIPFVGDIYDFSLSSLNPYRRTKDFAGELEKLINKTIQNKAH